MTFISWKLFSDLLANLFIHLEKVIIHHSCGLLLSDNEYVSLLIHNFLFWCKINKFISFFSKKTWKKCVLCKNKPKKIPAAKTAGRKIHVFTQVIHIVIHTLFDARHHLNILCVCFFT